MSQHSGFDPVLAQLSPDMCERLASKANSVGQAMNQRLAAQWAEGEIDVLFLHYLHGVVMAVLPNANMQQVLDLLCRLAAPTLAADALERALHAVPETEKPLFIRALETAEAIGRRDAESLRAEASGERAQHFETEVDNRVPNAHRGSTAAKDRWK